ncbi:MAG: APC family permease [Nitrospinae bacterium]|nr:APC family permease [Nitrospinota bacterium]
MSMSLKTFLIGRPIDTVKEKHERLGKAMGLAVFSSDALSSVAYATEEMLLPLMVLGAVALNYSLPIAAAIIGLIVLVAFSYMQTIRAYPSGGGAYIVAKENLGTNVALVAAAALLIDYVLTVIVSISAGVAAITSAFPALHSHTVALCLLSLLLIVIVNLRGIRESGAIFSGPTYIFIVSLAIVVVVGIWKYHTGEVTPSHMELPHEALDALPILLVLRAFSSGCTALTGIEAVANGVPAFKQPESRNASITLAWMATLLGGLFLGITYNAYVYGITPKENVTLVSQLVMAVSGGGPLYYLVQFATFMILILAANTSFADFPRLSSILARDYFLPRQLASQGDKLVYSNGIILLGVFGALLMVAFGGDTHAMIPLYTVGVFLAFTLSQSGMVVHWLKSREKGWFFGMMLNGVGGITTAAVLLVIASTKFFHGAWLVVAAIPMLIFLMWRVNRHYKSIAEQLVPADMAVEQPYTHHSVIIPVGGVHSAVVNAIKYGSSISEDVVAIYVCLDTRNASITQERWAKFSMGVPLIVLDSPYRSVIEPVVDYIEEVRKVHKAGVITVILPEFVPSRWWEHLLHNQTAWLLKGILLFKKGVVCTSVPFQLK